MTAHVAGPTSEGRLDDVEDELFRFSRILDGQPRAARRAVRRGRARRGQAAAAANLLGDKVDATTRAARPGGGRPAPVADLDARALPADRRGPARQPVATVWVAAPLNDEHHDRLAGALSAQHDRQVHLNVVVDPDVLGGVRVAIGDDVSTPPSRPGSKQAQRRLDTADTDRTTAADRRRHPDDTREQRQAHDGAHDPAGGDPGRAAELRLRLQAGGGQPRRGRHRRRGRRRHRPRRGPALGDGQRAARVRGRHARPRPEPRRPRDRCRHPR